MMGTLMLTMYLGVLCGGEEEARSKLQAAYSSGDKPFRVMEQVGGEDREFEVCAKDEASAAASVMAKHCDILVNPDSGKMALAHIGMSKKTRADGTKVRTLVARVTGGDWSLSKMEGSHDCG